MLTGQSKTDEPVSFSQRTPERGLGSKIIRNVLFGWLRYVAVFGLLPQD
jgi:hypothetical protein